MNIKFKLGAYAVLLLLAAWFGWGFHKNYAITTQASNVAATNDAPAAVTNVAVAVTNPSDASESSNAPSRSTNREATNTATNIAVNPAPVAPPPAHSAQGTMIAYLAALVGTIIGLGLLLAHDVTQIVGSAAVDAILDDNGEGLRDPDYEKAEEAWAAAKYLDAIQLMREFLKRNPRAQYAALRIAEIYEKDLHNPLAAALEYEEVLKQKLPAERWGWAAIHLCNLYTKLGQQDKTMEMLKRVSERYPKTAAAKKARARLGLPEPEPEPEPEAESVAQEENPAMALQPGNPLSSAAAKQPPPETPAPEPPKPKLPPGFRPKT